MSSSRIPQPITSHMLTADMELDLLSDVDTVIERLKGIRDVIDEHSTAPPVLTLTDMEFRVLRQWVSEMESSTDMWRARLDHRLNRRASRDSVQRNLVREMDTAAPPGVRFKRPRREGYDNSSSSSAVQRVDSDAATQPMVPDYVTPERKTDTENKEDEIIDLADTEDDVPPLPLPQRA